MQSENTWYYVKPLFNKIETVTVDRHTDAFVVIKGKRRSRATRWYYYEPSEEKAVQRLIEYHEDLVGRATTMLAVRQNDLRKAMEYVKGITKDATNQT